MNKIYFSKKAQGTIEYLVIIAIVVVISLVVVALLLGVFENNSDVSDDAASAKMQTSVIGVMDVAMGEDGNGLFQLRNNTGGLIKIRSISIDGVVKNYPDTVIALSSVQSFLLSDMTACVAGQIYDIEITYLTRDNLLKTEKFMDVKLPCIPQITATTTNITIEGYGDYDIGEEEEDPLPGGVDTTPNVSLNSGVLNLTNTTLTQTISFNVQSTDSKIIDCNMVVNGVVKSDRNYINTYLTNSTTYTITYAFSSTDTSYAIKCRDYNGSTKTTGTKGINYTPPAVLPEPELNITSLYLAPRGEMYFTLDNTLGEDIIIKNVIRDESAYVHQYSEDNQSFSNECRYRAYDEDNYYLVNHTDCRFAVNEDGFLTTTGTIVLNDNESQDYFVEGEGSTYCTAGETKTMDLNIIYNISGEEEDLSYLIENYSAECESGTAYYSYYNQKINIASAYPAVPVMSIGNIGSNGEFNLTLNLLGSSIHNWIDDKNYYLKAVYINDVLASGDHLRLNENGETILLANNSSNWVDTSNPNNYVNSRIFGKYCAGNTAIANLCNDLGLGENHYLNIKIIYDIVGEETDIIAEKNYFGYCSSSLATECIEE